MKSDARVLVVDDEQSMQTFLEIFFRREGYDVTTAGDVDTALLCVENDDFDVVITDVQMPEKSGLDLLRAVRGISPDTVVIMITAFASADTAISAMKEGAYDYVTKPFKVDELRLVVEKALEKRLLTSDNQRLRTELRTQVRNRSLVGSSSAIQRVYDLVAQVSDAKSTVLISGESGTGKELVARAIHDQGERSRESFVAINCGAIPENLLESELFGHVRGAFTGAVQSKDGLFETADGGTLFLDEVAELTPPLQVKLLRVIQERTIRRVGSNDDRSVDVRLLSATNRELEAEVAAGRFREDLYYRLNVIQIPIPPLRDRRNDIPLLANHFLEKYNAELGKTVQGFENGVIEKLMDYSYPGNVRELENVIERCVALCRSELIELELLPPTVMRARESDLSARIPPEGVDLTGLVDDYERALLVEALDASSGVKKRAAKLLGISFRSFRYRLEKLGVERADSKRS
jgi:two-component system response regulator PilR (NtrC family)